MVSCHMLSELEEVIQYKLVPERREIIRQIWWERLQVSWRQPQFPPQPAQGLRSTCTPPPFLFSSTISSKQNLQKLSPQLWLRENDLLSSLLWDFSRNGRKCV